VTSGKGPRGEPVLNFGSATDFERWLEKNATSSGPVWLRLRKRAAAASALTYKDAIESALCFGWIDGQKARGDEQFWLQRFSRRGPRSRWSKINRERAERLAAKDRLRTPGREEIERAKADGRWASAYEGQRSARVPEDLQKELDADPELGSAFATLSRADRYSIIWRLNDAKRPTTRERRLAKYLEMLRALGGAHS
jgi:uncharacterized protein YdeI (YjbR/CyaY-like superfamily)